MRDDFCVFIVSHGRPNNVKTIKTLKNAGYTGKLYIVLDDTDKTIDQYIKNFSKENIIVFNKEKAIEETDIMMQKNASRKAVVFARNQLHTIAERIGVKFFLELDDDYTDFEIRKIEENKLKTISIKKNIDQLFEACVSFVENTPTMVLALAQGGDFIGGAESDYAKKLTLKRKAMNSFFIDVNKKFKFLGLINEDTNMYVHLGNQGKLIFTVTNPMIVQTTTQQNAEGLTDIYLFLGTYVKSFYTVMLAPSCCSIAMMGDKHKRIHHKVCWRKCVPLILSENIKK